MKILYHFIATNERLKDLKKTTKIIVFNFGRFLGEPGISIVPVTCFFGTMDFNFDRFVQHFMNSFQQINNLPCVVYWYLSLPN